MARKRKKRKQRRSKRQSAAPAVPPAAAETPLAAVEPPVSRPDAAHATDADDAIDADLDAVLDGDGSQDSYESLVAAVSELEEPAGPAPEADVEIEAVHDLDDDVVAGSIEGLIAEVGRTPDAGARLSATEGEADEDLPVIDLDADLPAAVRPGPLAGAPQANPDISRLARAAAAGALDDSEPPAVPLDLFGDISTPEARARLLAEALAHAEHKEARYRVPLADTRRAARWKSSVAAVLLVLAGVVAVSPPVWVRPEPPAQLTEAARARGVRLALILQAHQIDAYRIRTQELPSSLDDLPVRLDGVRYTRSGRSYQLVAFTPGGDAIVYDAADPSPAFRVLEGALAAVEAP